jgi:hypothetical protein
MVMQMHVTALGDLKPEKITSPILDAECSLVDSGLRPGRLNFRLEGGRGYVTKSSATYSEGWQTPRLLKILRDDLKILTGASVETFYGSGIYGSFETSAVMGKGAASLTGLDYNDNVDGPIGLVQWKFKQERPTGAWRTVGICRVRATGQEPLSAAETAKEIAK